MNYLRTLVLLAICIGFGQAQIDPEVASWKTGDRFNGRFWRTLDERGKTTYLAGYLEALQMAAGNAAKESPVQLIAVTYWPSLNVGEVQTSLDRIYDTPENRRIPIGDIVSFPIVMRSYGADEEQVQKKIAELRAKAALK